MVMDEEQRSRSLARIADTVIMYAEMAIYAVVCVVLVMGAVALLIEAVKSFFTDMDDGVLWAATQMLSVLLLVFVFVELLGAVRSTVRERRLVAEPFLLVGIIAAIKEIVLIGGTERVIVTDDQLFNRAMIEIAILAGVVLLLAISTLLLRNSAARRREVEVESPEPG
jgi:uncharacterized membrane protein (DUF373 family)